jgi:hypothetical protein
MVMSIFSDIKMPQPEVSGLLPEVPGGEPNLIPATLTHDDLKVWFTVPAHSDPSADEETVELFVDYVDDTSIPISKREWSAPIEDSDQFVWLPKAWLRNVGNEGQHRLAYRFTIYNGAQEFSEDLVITLDIMAPVLAADSKLIFPREVLPSNKLTARYLEQNSDQVKVELPGYTAPRPWDRITWHWGVRLSDENPGGVIELNDTNYTLPVKFNVTGDLIRDRGNGVRYVRYEIKDRAGNVSKSVDFVELDVDATPIPRKLPPSKVKEASSGASSGVLIPSHGVNGVTVTIPSDAVIYEGEEAFVQWAAPGTVGEFRTNTPVSAGSREYNIPKDKIAQHLGKTLPVYYEVIEPGVTDPHKSQNYSLRVEELTGLPSVQCTQVAGGKLSLASLTTGFADFTLASWTFMATDQYLTVTVVGVDSNSQKLEIPILTDSRVPEVAPVISVGRIAKADLQRFKLNLGFEVVVKVSFDSLQTWKTFGKLTPQLIA